MDDRMKTPGCKPIRFELFLLGALMAAFVPGMALGEPLDAKIQDAVSSYNRQEYENAAKLFQEAQADRPGDPGLSYNLGNSAYKQGKFDQALHAYAKAATGDSTLRQKSLYNTGNALFRLGKLEEAASAYKEALKLDPNDMDSKFNLEFAREQLKKRQQQKDEKKEDRQDKKDKDSQKGEGGQDNSSSKHGSNKGGDAQDKNENGRSGKKEDRRDKPGKGERDPNKPGQGLAGNDSPRLPQSAREAGSMTKEEAEQWLRSLTEDPKKLVQAQIRQDPSKKETPDNDW